VSGGTNVRTQMVSRHMGICVCGDKIRCPPWQLNGGCIEGYCPGQSPDRPILTTHIHGSAECEVRYKEGSRAVGPSLSENNYSALI